MRVKSACFECVFRMKKYDNVFFLIIEIIEMGKITRFEDLECWKAARVLANMVYRITGDGKLSRDFGLKDQIQRASVSVMNNVAEGFTRFSRKEFARFLVIAQSSCAEVMSMLYLLDDLGYEDKSKLLEIRKQGDKTRALILGMIKYLKNNKL
jgi:four helix bundle protein